MTIVGDGRPIFAGGDDERIGRGPWARLLVTSVLPDEGSARAERARVLARTGHVHSVSVAAQEVAGVVIGSSGTEYRASLSADPVSPRVWAAVAGSPRGRALFEGALSGREQSLQLEHAMTIDWEEPLVPPARSLRHSCTCPDAGRSGACKHVGALAYVFASAIDDTPGLLLEWRGYSSAAADPPAPVATSAPLERGADSWIAGPLPEIGVARPLPVGSVLKRLGPSGLVIDGVDLRDVLEPAYAAFSGRQD